ncbi:hypothetical protein RRG08_045930 [Elysia crispata]|uniref:Uncharacterized protein n=1 Tax=Elysia crispata TaxID=231223 RepID=A0AAE1AS94_9GAST|nr:hypothetical protein RRG08_045930 [Elysia crispata]
MSVGKKKTVEEDEGDVHRKYASPSLSACRKAILATLATRRPNCLNSADPSQGDEKISWLGFGLNCLMSWDHWCIKNLQLGCSQMNETTFHS